MKGSAFVFASCWFCIFVACSAEQTGRGDAAALDAALAADSAGSDAAVGSSLDGGEGDAAVGDTALLSDGGESDVPSSSLSDSGEGDAAAGDAGPLPDADVGDAACLDIDGDGHCHSRDCDDQNATVHPSRTEICGNAIDDNCDGAVDEGCLDGTQSYFVDRESLGGQCADSNPGTLTAPWCTTAKANAALGAGDTLYIRAGTYTDETIQPQASGLSESRRITYTAYNDEEVVFTQSVYCVRVQSKSYVTVLGLRFHDCERNLYLQASSHINVGHCEFDTPMGPTTWAGSRFYEGSQYNRIYNNTFSRYGAQSGSDPDYQDYGCNLDIGNDNQEDNSDHNLVINNTFFYGGHHVLGIYSDHNIVRGNTFHNEEWFPCHRDDIGGLCGNRNVILNTSVPDGNVRNVIEDNKIGFSGVPPDQVASAGLSVRTQYNIIRRNLFYHSDSAGLTLSTDSGNNNNPSNNYVYHNVFYHNGYPLLDDWDPRKTGMMLARWQDSPSYNAMAGVAIKNNVFHDNQMHAIYYYYVDREEQMVANNWEEEGDPGFVSASVSGSGSGQIDPFDFDVYDFHLRAQSPCIDNGGFLTQTTNAGQNSTTLAVENAGYFTAGNGVAEPDMIQIEGQPKAMTIVDIDYNTNTIAVEPPSSWPMGAGVSLPYLGLRPDQGAYEHEP